MKKSVVENFIVSFILLLIVFFVVTLFTFVSRTVDVELPHKKVKVLVITDKAVKLNDDLISPLYSTRYVDGDYDYILCFKNTSIPRKHKVIRFPECFDKNFTYVNQSETFNIIGNKITVNGFYDVKGNNLFSIVSDGNHSLISRDLNCNFYIGSEEVLKKQGALIQLIERVCS